MKLPLVQDVKPVFEAIRARGGRGLLVGGFVRDMALRAESKDLDVEVYGLSPETLEEILSSFGEGMVVGRSFGVFKIKRLDVEIDFSMPRCDSKVGPGHKGFVVEADPRLPLHEAARRRDFTMNSMAFDPLSGEWFDPYGGREDLERGLLRVTDPATFAEDPLRALRAAQFVSQFELTPDPQTLQIICEMVAAGLTRELPGERLREEIAKILLKGPRLSLGLGFMKEVGILDEFPELRVLVGCQQDPEWHPEGDVWVHTLMVVDAAAGMRSGDSVHDLALMLAALCHDLGKPSTTAFAAGRWQSRNHEEAGAAPTRTFLDRLRGLQEGVPEAVVALVVHHLAPEHAQKGRPGPAAYRRLARKMAAAGTTLTMLEKVARADHLGRTTEEARAGEFPAGDFFLCEVRCLNVDREPPRDVVMGRHLLVRGMSPGPQMGAILARCREAQDETGLQDPEEILERVLPSGDDHTLR